VKGVDVAGRLIVEPEGCLELQALGVGDDGDGPPRVGCDDQLGGGGLACAGACRYDDILGSRQPYNRLLLC